ncbi:MULTISPECIES: tetratricopeptide repeat protein [unclassified Pseudomonas]|uniref:tetratricopeptide repeat protein n=1 Tax=unclassified Pseudomonas TaxID=196821 RepID=UPI001EE23E23|nr:MULTISPECIES: tetratricopeptide repeat protein [unclassified Pseudomonas]
MRFFDWLFKNKTEYQSRVGAPAAKAQTIDLGRILMTVNSLNYRGLYHFSKSKSWALSWRDWDPISSKGGQRDSGLGEYVLVDVSRDIVSAHGKMPRPNNGSIADNGSFSLEDWHFGSALSGTFRVFDSNGVPVVTKELTANILDSGISRNGKLAFCITANSPTDHANKLFLFDLGTGTELFSITPRTAGTDSYSFDEEGTLLIVDVMGVGKYRYDKNGVFLDADKLDGANLCSSQYDRIILAADRILGEPGLSEAGVRTVLKAITRARSIGADANPSWKPMALKAQGLAHEILGQHLEAIQVYEEAITLNPKIGVKRKLDALKKMVG